MSIRLIGVVLCGWYGSDSLYVLRKLNVFGLCRISVLVCVNVLLFVLSLVMCGGMIGIVGVMSVLKCD